MGNIELVDEVKVHEHPYDSFQSQAVVDERVVELVTERKHQCEKRDQTETENEVKLVLIC